jgi:nicotinate-nucleotide--dimethylbenzimidazole phosphoribosyltransferase
VENPLTDLSERPREIAASSQTALSRKCTAHASPDWQAFAKAKLDSLTKPPGSLGRLEEIAAKIVSIREQESPGCSNKAVYVFAADHGVTEEGVSAYPKVVTQQMVRNFLANAAAINIFARCARAEVIVIDVGVDADFDSHLNLVGKKIRRGTRNMATGPAMTESEMGAAIAVGQTLAQQARLQNRDLMAVGEMGIGNTTAAAAVTAALSGKPVAEVTGLGTGVSPQALVHKRQIVERALTVNGLLRESSPLDVLRKVGGLEIAAMTGTILEAQEQRVPVVIDGFISTAAAALAYAIEPKVRNVLFAGHVSEEPGHRVLLEYIGLDPILNLGLRLGEGTGAVLAVMVIEAAVSMFNEMATFSSAGVSGAL